MFNCYIVYLGTHQVAIFGTEIAAENFVYLFNQHRAPPAAFTIIGAYIADVGF